MSDIENTSVPPDNATDSVDATQAQPKAKKRSGISLPFLLIVAVLGVAGYFGVKQFMFMSMLNEMQGEVDKVIETDPDIGKNGPAAPIQSSSIES